VQVAVVVHGAQPARSITSHTRLWRSAFVPSRSNGCCGSAAEAEQGHGAEAIWGVHPTASIISWIPLMIFAFLYGLSMDYEVFMLTRMRKIYDETGETDTAISLGLARTGKLVTSAALVLMFAFLVLSSGPGVDSSSSASAWRPGSSSTRP
jgi:MMPL family